MRIARANLKRSMIPGTDLPVDLVRLGERVGVLGLPIIGLASRLQTTTSPSLTSSYAHQGTSVPHVHRTSLLGGEQTVALQIHCRDPLARREGTFDPHDQTLAPGVRSASGRMSNLRGRPRNSAAIVINSIWDVRHFPIPGGRHNLSVTNSTLVGFQQLRGRAGGTVLKEDRNADCSLP